MDDVRYLVDSATDAAFAIDGELKIAAWNEPAQRLLGYTRREVVGRRCSEVLEAILPNGETVCGGGCHGLQCLSRRQPVAVPECIVRRKDGGWVRARLASSVKPEQIPDADARAGVAAIFLRVDGKEDEARR